MLPLVIYIGIYPIFYIFKKAYLRILSIFLNLVLVSIIYNFSLYFSVDPTEYNPNNINYKTGEGELSKFNILNKKIAYLSIDPISKQFLDFDDSITVDFFKIPIIRYVNISTSGDTLYKGVILNGCFVGEETVDCNLNTYFKSLSSTLDYMYTNGSAKLHSKIPNDYYVLVALYFEEIYNLSDRNSQHNSDIYLKSDTFKLSHSKQMIRKYFMINQDKINSMQKEIIRKKKLYLKTIVWSNEPYATLFSFAFSIMDIQESKFNFYPMN